MVATIQELPGSALNAIPDVTNLRFEIGRRKIELDLLRKLLKVAEDRNRLADTIPDRTPTPSATDAAASR